MAKAIYMESAKLDKSIYLSGPTVEGERLLHSRKGPPKKDNVVSQDEINLKRAVKVLSKQMREGMLPQSQQPEEPKSRRLISG